MIRFFRSLRQHIMKKSKIGHYLLYATGEIILVVIGILIALQINTWNQERVNQREAKAIKKNLLEDLIKDSLMIHNKKVFYQNLREKNNQILSRINADNATLKTFIEGARDFDPTFDLVFSFNNITINTAENTGKIDLLDESLNRLISQYKNAQSSLLIDFNINIYLDRVNQFLVKYRFGNINGAYQRQLNTKIENEKEFVNLFSQMCGYKEYMMRSAIASYNNALTQARVLILELERQLNNS